jgi:hypothetical protein
MATSTANIGTSVVVMMPPWIAGSSGKSKEERQERHQSLIYSQCSSGIKSAEQRLSLGRIT